jgi:predicted DNA-binding antitoxin AbrB/MazE fold protein
MSQTVEAVFENGVFRPLQPVTLSGQRRVTITIENSPEHDAAQEATNALLRLLQHGPDVRNHRTAGASAGGW